MYGDVFDKIVWYIGLTFKMHCEIFKISQTIVILKSILDPKKIVTKTIYVMPRISMLVEGMEFYRNGYNIT